MMGMLDWVIVAGLMFSLLAATIYSRRFTRSVADFLAANRCAGRYLLTICAGMSALCATTIIAAFEGIFVGGLTNSWWNLGQGLIVSVLMISGWIVYRFRQTRALTLAQFLEIRYSRRFRIFTGAICWLSGMVNFGIFPAICARFMMSICLVPPDAAVAGIPVYVFFLLALIIIPALLTVFGGQITVILTDYIQGVFCSLMMITVTIAAICVIGIPALDKTLLESVSRQNRQVIEQSAEKICSGATVENIVIEKSNPKAAVLKDALRYAVKGGAQTPADIASSAVTYYQNNDSLIHPMKIKGKADLNIWFYLMSFWMVFYGGRIWQGSQGFNASALTPHEARMGNVMAPFRLLPQAAFCIVLPICALAYFNSDTFLNGSAAIKSYLTQLGNPNLQRQMATPLAMMEFLPIGLRGCFVALMLAALISTFDAYMHSWGSIFIQDVVMPFRKTPLTQEKHLKMLRLSIGFVCLFIFVFSLVMRQTEYIVMFWNITGAIFTGGAGAVVIGGLYWKRGTTGAAWSAMITGSTLAVSGILLRQVHSAHPFSNPVLEFIASKNGMVLAFWAGVIAMTVYFVISLLKRGEPFNMDKMLHRGAYTVKADDHTVAEQPVKGFRALMGVTKEFTRSDRIIYVISVSWTLFFAGVFLIGTIWNSLVKAPDTAWLAYWKYYVGLFLCVGTVTTLWFSIGGFVDVIRMFKRLKVIQRNEADDGTVFKAES
jgi:SSS family solute:Na+ symporter